MQRHSWCFLAALEVTYTSNVPACEYDVIVCMSLSDRAGLETHYSVLLVIFDEPPSGCLKIARVGAPNFWVCKARMFASATQALPERANSARGASNESPRSLERFAAALTCDAQDTVH